MANICCSIELEPRTLNQGQINQAREVAADVVEKLEPSEASALFIEGFIHADPMREMGENGGQFEKVVGYMERAEGVINDEKACQCSCTAAPVESPDQNNLKEPLSAPF